MTQEDLDNLQKAIATGELKVKVSTDAGTREIEYRSMDDLMKAYEFGKRQLAGAKSAYAVASWN